MLRLIGASVAGVLAWAVVVTLLNLGLRHGWHDYASVEHDYAAVEKAMTFTLAMMVARLSMSAAASLASGAVAAWLGRSPRPPLLAGIVLLLLFLPVHYTLWDRFPVWYHLTFLVSLPLLGWAGGSLLRRGTDASLRW